ncbi:S-norcoclaurine synthase 1-like [Cryptomeria japonica]|uniref:S-norcoclaurine synthase 1-like n=1 Tax=Cryptomeria japonica TaxID=3369 RepID=UPI0027DA1DBC|nr:S-norcoclaurine synthase 1-like [Cryptomeria japonica]
MAPFPQFFVGEVDALPNCSNVMGEFPPLVDLAAMGAGVVVAPSASKGVFVVVVGPSMVMGVDFGGLVASCVAGAKIPVILILKTIMFNSRMVFDPSDGTTKMFSVPVVQELASQNLHSLPERYIRSEKERPNSFPLHHLEIPIIDMDMFWGDSDLCRQKELEKLGMACQQWGFFQAVNHGIPVSLTERMKGIAKEFIQLPLEEKLKYKIQEIEGYGQSFVTSEDQELDWADMMSLATLPPENRNMDFWPTKPADFRETVDQYALETQKLSNTLLCLLSENVGLKPDCFVNMCGKMGQRMRLNYYPPRLKPDLVLGISPHSDAFALTVLLQDDGIVGLQIHKDGEWVPVQPIPGALVINVGDILEVISNGIYKSIEHRAVTNTDRDRISIAMFHGPGSRETELGPAPELIDELHPCQYKRFINGDFMQHVLSGKLDGKNNIEFAKISS